MVCDNKKHYHIYRQAAVFAYCKQFAVTNAAMKMRCRSLKSWLILIHALVILLTVYHVKFRLNSANFAPHHCNCDRSTRTQFQIIHGEQSTCDEFSTSRGRNQKVVSFSFYGQTSNIYFQGVKQTVVNVKHFYPGWIMRLYHNINTNEPKQKSDLCHLWCENDHLDVCDVSRLPPPLGNRSQNFGLVWRFFTLGDPLVNIFIIRDIDGPILQREVDAVAEWIRTYKTFHIMRDHPFHHMPILGGMWGAMNHNRTLMLGLREQIIADSYNWTGDTDQQLLNTLVWPIINGQSVIHDSYNCNVFSRSSPFPTRRDNLTYIGMYFDWRNLSYPPPPCPLECRPQDHQDWEYC